MKNIKKVLFILYFVIVVLLKFSQKIGYFDEIWNFNMARNFLYGNLPYRNFNMIIFPAFPFILSVLLKIFGNQFLVYRIFQIFLCVIALKLSWKIIDKFDQENNIFLYFVNWVYFLFLVCNNIMEYNFFSLVLVEWVVLLEFSKNNYRNRFLIGVLLGILILTKQTIGISVVFFSITSIFFTSDKNKFKKIITEILGIIFPLIFLIIYIFSNSIQNEFVDYTFFSGSDFLTNGKNFLKFLGMSEIIICFIILIITIAFFIQTKKDENKIKLFLYAFSMLSVSFPIVDNSHLSISL